MICAAVVHLHRNQSLPREDITRKTSSLWNQRSKRGENVPKVVPQPRMAVVACSTEAQQRKLSLYAGICFGAEIYHYCNSACSCSQLLRYILQSEERI